MDDMKKIVVKITVLFLMLGPMAVSAQLKTGNKLYDQYKYNKAIPYFLKSTESKKHEERNLATVKLANCYRMINAYEEASEWYEKILKGKDVGPEVYFNYGTVLRSTGNYEEAKKCFDKYLKSNPEDKRAVAYVKFCDEIAVWKDLEASAEIRNLKTVNTQFAEFSPVPLKKGLMFVSDREVDMVDNNNFLWTGNGFLNLYKVSMEINDDSLHILSAPQKMSNDINQKYHDGPACFSSDEKIIYTTRTSKQKISRKDTIKVNYSKIFYAVIAGKKIEFVDFKYNGDNFSVGHPTISHDGNTLIFSSDMPGGTGESDLYYCIKENEEWSTPINIGENVNTFGNEYFPYLANDTTLYFSSDGLMGYGGLDIFVTQLKNGEWQKPFNLKSPINSSYDDFGITLLGNKKDGFFSSNRPGGKGSDDIYQFMDLKKVSGK